MSVTVQKNLLSLAGILNPVTKKGQVFKGSDSAIAITGAATNAGLIRITAAGHGLNTGDQCYIIGVGGVTAANNTLANPNWTVTKITSSTFDLQGSTFAGTFSGSAGTVTPCLIGSVNGSRFTAQRLLDCYNQARMAMFRASKSRQRSISSRNASSTSVVPFLPLTLSANLSNEPLRTASREKMAANSSHFSA